MRAEGDIIDGQLPRNCIALEGDDFLRFGQNVLRDAI